MTRILIRGPKHPKFHCTELLIQLFLAPDQVRSMLLDRGRRMSGQKAGGFSPDDDLLEVRRPALHAFCSDCAPVPEWPDDAHLEWAQDFYMGNQVRCWCVY